MSEAALHKAVVDFLTLALPYGAVLHHSPNAGKRGWYAQAALKTHGVQKGWPDIEVLYKGQPFFVELKAPRKYADKDQRACHERLRAAGCHVAICRSIEEVDGYLRALMPLRTRPVEAA